MAQSLSVNSVGVNLEANKLHEIEMADRVENTVSRDGNYFAILVLFQSSTRPSNPRCCVQSLFIIKQ